MSYKKYFNILLCVGLCALAAKLVLAYLIDPIGIWGAPIVHGFNHYKVKQVGYMDVYKPYEYIREKPDILYIGASNIFTGFEPIRDVSLGGTAYNMGLSSLTLSDMREYLRFVYKVHKPKIIFVGLNPRHFMSSYVNLKSRRGFSLERLEQLTGSPLMYQWQAIKDSLQIADIYWETVKASRDNNDKETLIVRGWDTVRGTVSLKSKIYYKYIGDECREPAKDWIYAPEALNCWRTIVAEAKDAGVPLVTFFAPCSIDLYAIKNLICRDEWQRAKRAASQVSEIYDFCVVNELAINREKYFYDTGHFRARCGEKIKKCLEIQNPKPYGYLLTPETVDNALMAEDVAWEKW